MYVSHICRPLHARADPLGIPAAFFFLLWRQGSSINPPTDRTLKEQRGSQHVVVSTPAYRSVHKLWKGLVKQVLAVNYVFRVKSPNPNPNVKVPTLGYVYGRQHHWWCRGGGGGAPSDLSMSRLSISRQGMIPPEDFRDGLQQRYLIFSTDMSCSRRLTCVNRYCRAI